jgi:hypothetical protein
VINMLRKFIVRTSIATAAVLALAVPRAAMASTIDGVITEVELRDAPRHITVRSGGENVQIRVAARTRVDFGAVDQGYFSPELSSLKPGMEVRVTSAGDEPATLVDVTSVPATLRREALQQYERTGRLPAAGPQTSVSSDAQELKVRLTDVNRARGTFRADVAGESRTFRAEDPKLLARFDEGDLVVVRVDPRDNIVTDIRSSSLSGRVIDIDHTAGVVRVDVDGRTETFKIDRIKGLRLREGDRVRFQVEERKTGERVITQINRD